MKKMMCLVALLGALWFNAPIWALEEEGIKKIGLLNRQELIHKLPQMKKIEEDLKNQFADRKKKFLAAQETFTKEAQEFGKESPTMKPEEKAATEQKLFGEQRALQQMQTEIQRDYMAAQTKKVEDLMVKVREATQRVADREKIDLVLVEASIVYSRKNIDITPQVLKEMTQ